MWWTYWRRWNSLFHPADQLCHKRRAEFSDAFSCCRHCAIWLAEVGIQVTSWASNKSLWDVHLESESEMCFLLSKWTGWYLVHTHSWQGLWTADVGISPNCKWSLNSKEYFNTKRHRYHSCKNVLQNPVFWVFLSHCHVSATWGQCYFMSQDLKAALSDKTKENISLQHYSRNDTVCSFYLLIVIFPKTILSFFRVDRGEDTFTITFWLIFVTF